MNRIKENCRCGAIFEAEGSHTFCEYRYSEFLAAHKVCRNVSPNKPVEPTDTTATPFDSFEAAKAWAKEQADSVCRFPEYLKK